ncbi:hypothetical protein BDQ12DRAFT_601171, partial [Crucibulum laeve]
TVQVSGIAPTTTETQLHDFFTFCGKITSIEHKEKSGTAVINFEKASAAKTAAMLNGGTLDGATLTVASDNSPADDDHQDGGEGIDQSDKPRAGIAAEYLAKGYVLSENVLSRAIELDQKQGISKRFLNYFNSLDHTVGSKAIGPDQTVSGKAQSTIDAAVQRAKAVDEQKGFSKVANDYYTRAISSAFGQQVRDFYTNTAKEITHIHEEARRIAEQEKQKSTSASTEATPAPPPAGSAAMPEPKTQAAPTVI